MTKAVITNLTSTTINTDAMDITNDNFDNLNAQLPADVDWAIVSVAWTQTITNKTLTSPTINTPTVTNPTVTTGTFTSPTLVTPALGTPSSGTLTNCTFPTLNQNTTGSADSLRNATGVVSTAAATAPTSGQALVATSSTTATWQGNGYWDFAIKLDTDFVVTNNATLQDVTGFSFAAAANESWYVEIIGNSAASDATGDIKCDLVTTGTWLNGSSFSYGLHYNTTWSLATSWPFAFNNTTTALASPVINNWDAVVRAFRFQFNIVQNTSGNIKFQIANVAAAGGRTSTIKAGTYMLARKLST